jgi:hypothetical protein
MDAMPAAANQPLKFRIECISIESDFIESYLTLVLTTQDASLYFREGNAVRIPLVHGEFYRTYPAIENKFRSKGYRLKGCGSCSSFVLRPFSATRETGYCSSSVGSRRGGGVHLLDSCDDFEFRDQKELRPPGQLYCARSNRRRAMRFDLYPAVRWLNNLREMFGIGPAPIHPTPHSHPMTRLNFSTMSETAQMILSIVALMAVYILSQLIVGYRISRAARVIIHDLDRQQAYDPITAVELPYAKRRFLRIGLRDFRPNAVEALIEVKVLSRTHAGKFYLKRRIETLRMN